MLPRREAFLDAERNDLLPPLSGLNASPDLSFEGSVNYAWDNSPQLRDEFKKAGESLKPFKVMASKAADKRVSDAAKAIPEREEPLSADQIASIKLYTQESPFYVTLNSILRTSDRSLIKPFFPFLKIFLSAALLLGFEKRTVYRGVPEDLSKEYPTDTEVVWWSITSGTESFKTLGRFLGNGCKRTMIAIETRHAIDISKYSAVKLEYEWILLPGSQLKVASETNPADGFNMIRMVETDPPMILDLFSKKPPLRQQLDSSSEEYKKVREEAEKATCLPHGYRCCVQKIDKISNPKQESEMSNFNTIGEVSQQKMLFHGTLHWSSIIDKGFQLPTLQDEEGNYLSEERGVREKLLFGKAIYFAEESSKSHLFSGQSHVLLYCRVELGKSMVMDKMDATLESSKMRALGYDSATSGEGVVLSKEYAVYHPSQAVVCYAIHYFPLKFRTIENVIQALQNPERKNQKSEIDSTGLERQESSKSVGSGLAEEDIINLLSEEAYIVTKINSSPKGLLALQDLGDLCRDFPSKKSLKNTHLWRSIIGALGKTENEVIQWHLLRICSCFALLGRDSLEFIWDSFASATSLLHSQNESVVQRASFLICNLTAVEAPSNGDYVSALVLKMNQVNEDLSRIYIVCSLCNAIKYHLLTLEQISQILLPIVRLVVNYSWRCSDWFQWTVSFLLNCALQFPSEMKLYKEELAIFPDLVSFEHLKPEDYQLYSRWLCWFGHLDGFVSGEAIEHYWQNRSLGDPFWLLQALFFHKEETAKLFWDKRDEWNGFLTSFPMGSIKSTPERICYGNLMLSCDQSLVIQSKLPMKKISEWAALSYSAADDQLLSVLHPDDWW